MTSHPLTISADWASGARPRTGQAIDPTQIFSAAISITGPGMAAPVTATASLVSGAGVDVVLPVPNGPNRVVEVRGIGLDGNQVSTQAIVRGVASVPDDSEVRVSWRTTPTADVILALRQLGSPLESSVDRNALQAFVNRLIFGTGDGAPAVPYAVHPALVDTAGIAARIAQIGEIPPSAAGYALAGGRVTGRLTGLMAGQTATVTVDDPASEPVETDAAGNYLISGAAPGTGLIVRATHPRFEATSSPTVSVQDGATSVVDMKIGGQYIDAGTWAGFCGVSDVRHRFTQLPIRVLEIVPAGANAVSEGFAAEHIDSMDSALATLRNAFAPVLEFEVSKIFDDDSNLASEIRRSDIYIQWIDGTICGSSTAIGCSTTYPGQGSLPACETDAVVKNLSYQNKVQIRTRYAGGAPLEFSTHRQTALHELIHALGLGHSGDVRDTMYPVVGMPHLTLGAGDSNTIRLLYSLPANLTRDHAAYDLVPNSQNDGSFSYGDTAPGETSPVSVAVE